VATREAVGRRAGERSRVAFWRFMAQAGRQGFISRMILECVKIGEIVECLLE
jgi:hypothetical protein